MQACSRSRGIVHASLWPLAPIYFVRYCTHVSPGAVRQFHSSHRWEIPLITKRQIMEAVTGLPPHDLADIIEWCHSFGPRSTKYSDNPNTEHAYNELSSCFADYFHLPAAGSLLRFSHARPRQYKALIKAADHAMRCVDAWWPRQPRIVKIGLLRYLCRVAFDVSTRRTARLTWNRVTDALLETEATVNDGFPGWLQAGIFQERALAQVTKGHHVRQQSASKARVTNESATR